MLPLEVISHILAFASTYDVCRCRGVNSQWYKAASEQQGRVQLCFIKQRLLGTARCAHYVCSRDRSLCRIQFNGHYTKTSDLTKKILEETKLRMDSKEETRKSWYNRTRGRLPEPRMPELPRSSGDNCDSITTKIQVPAELAADEIPDRFLPFLLHVNVGESTCLSLNLSSSTVEVGVHDPKFDRLGRLIPGRIFCSSPMKNYLCEVNLCGLTHLQHISMRSMSALKKIFLPATIIALDANSCTNLEEIHIPMYGGGCEEEEKEQPELISVNWSGCRALQSVFGPTCTMERAMVHVKELDLSYTSRLPNKEVTAALQSTTSLQSVSIRYVATDEVILALSQSTSSRSGILKLVDVAFSPDLTDKAINSLVENSSRLERVNMRGCRSISSECYNNTPIVLQRRQQQQAASASRGSTSAAASSKSAFLLKETVHDLVPSSSTSDGNQSTTTPFRKRKGDNLFFFASSSLEQKKPRTKRKNGSK